MAFKGLEPIKRIIVMNEIVLGEIRNFHILGYNVLFFFFL
jgi:hypothetical protein